MQNKLENIDILRVNKIVLKSMLFSYEVLFFVPVSSNKS